MAYIPQDMLFESRCAVESDLAQGAARQLFQARRMTGDPTALLVSFDDVALVRPIDGGRFADVFLGRLHDLPCAIKMIRKEAGEHARRDFESEEVLMGSLWKGGHPNVVSLYASQMLEQPHFLVLELMASSLLDTVRESALAPMVCRAPIRAQTIAIASFSGLVHETDSSLCWDGLSAPKQRDPLRSCGAQCLRVAQWHVQGRRLGDGSVRREPPVRD